MIHTGNGDRQTLRVGTRGSLLARTQTGWVIEQLKQAWPDLQVELITIRSSGDKIQDRPLHEFGGKGLFTKELEQALLARDVDLAVHSFKDVPVTMPLVDTSELVFAAVPPREDPRDVLVSRSVRKIEDLPQGALVGTGSLRRQCQILSVRGDLNVQMIRGNIDSRLKKLREGQYEAIVLAMAGVKRAGLFDESYMTPLPPEGMTPSAGQGALALQCRESDQWTREIVGKLNHADSFLCVQAERAVVLELGGDCHSPIGAWAQLSGDEMTIGVALGERDGRPPVKRAMVKGPAAFWHDLVKRSVAELR